MSKYISLQVSGGRVWLRLHPPVEFLLLSAKEAEDLASQLLSLAQDIRNEKEKENA